MRVFGTFFKRWEGWLIAIVVTSQLLLPLHYYVARRDPHDERFAWRMFSPMRMTHCTPHVAINGQPFSLPTEFHEAWVELAERGRFVVVEAMAAKLCREHAGASVEVSLDCTYLDREPRTWGGYDMCRVPML